MNLRRLKLALFATPILAFNVASAQSLSNLPGAFSEVAFGVRPAGMGQAYTAISNDANAFLTNPAGFLLGDQAQVTANYAKLFGLIPSSYIGALSPLSRTTALGGGFLYVGDEVLSEYTVGVSMAFTLPNWPLGGREIYFDQMSFGITIKGRWANFGNNSGGGENRVTGSGRGFGVDLGYMFLLNRHLSLGLIVRDLINTFRWDSSVSGAYTEGVPATVRLGGAYRLDGTILAIDFRKALHEDTADRAYMGVEHALLAGVSLRAGFSNNIGTADLNRQWSFGMGLMPKIADAYSIAIHAAYRVDSVDNVLRFGADFYWGTNKTRPDGRVY